MGAVDAYIVYAILLVMSAWHFQRSGFINGYNKGFVEGVVRCAKEITDADEINIEYEEEE